MKKNIIPLWLFCMMISLTFFTECTQKPVSGLNSEDFHHPPARSSIHAWWHWVDNAITREGITRDLEAMKDQGISTVTILNVSLFGERDLGVPQVIFDTEEWYGMFEWALIEANRLGMTIGAHNCDGWSSSGGPWINTENAMKQCTWSKSYVAGGRHIELELPVPKNKLDFYRDIAILAIPVNAGPNSFQISQPGIKADGILTGDILYDANPFSTVVVKNGSIIDIEFKNVVTISQIAIHPRVEFSWEDLDNIRFQFDLNAVDNGSNYRTIGQLDGPALNKTTVIETGPVSSKHFRIIFKNLTGSRTLEISEIELLGEQEKPAFSTSIPFHLEKIAATMAHNTGDLRVHGTDPSDAVSVEDVVDITQYVNSDGILAWDPPEGNWEILRIGYTATGAQNAPATKAGRGLECDKMDTAALNLHFRGFPAKLIAHAGDYAGNTFEYLFIDSWECGYQNWTGNFASEFEKRRQYSINKWLPVICGVTINDPGSTERFLYDFQKTIAELIEENYYRHFGKLCSRNGVKSHAEVIYGGTGYPPLDILRSNSYFDVPMFEFWANPDSETGFISYSPVNTTAFEIPAHAGALYGKNVVTAEAYTGYANYTELPWDLKLFGDKEFCSGINQMVLHSYVHQPFEKKPGVTLGVFGQSFNRHNPWWDFASQWFDYHARVQNVLQQGVPVADILYFVGDGFYDDLTYEGLYELPASYRIQKCNLDILMNHCSVKNGKLLLDNGLSYELLLLPDNESMTLESLQRIAELTRAGAKIAGPRPVTVPGNLNYQDNLKSLQEIVEDMWGRAEGAAATENRYGKGKIFSDKKLKDILDEMQITPDFIVPDELTGRFIYIHKKIGNDDVYFVVNQEDKMVECDCIFRVKGKVPEIWDPQYGTISRAGAFSESEGKTIVEIKFQPRESLFFVFRDVSPADLPEYIVPEQKFTPETLERTIAFEDMTDKKPLTINGLSSLTESNDPDIKYYSGKALCKLKFDLPTELLQHKPLYLSMDGSVYAYELRFNDNLLGCSVFPIYRFDVSSFARETGNILEVRIAIPYRNRIIGDFIQYGSLKNLWTTSPVTNLPGKDKPLLEAGLPESVVFFY